VSPRGGGRALEGGGQAPVWRVIVMRADGSGQHLLVRNSSRGGHPVTWSPDGSKSDGSGQKRLTGAHVGSFDPAWSPDGTKIAFTSDRGMEDGIYVMSPDGSRQRRLTHGGGESAAWSPVQPFVQNADLAWQPAGHLRSPGK
jgi:Tol biopolymer transport system component